MPSELPSSGSDAAEPYLVDRKTEGRSAICRCGFKRGHWRASGVRKDEMIWSPPYPFLHNTRSPSGSETHTAREHLNDVLSQHHRHGELVQEGCVPEAPLKEIDQRSTNRLVDGGHSRPDRPDAPDAEYSVAKTSSSCSHLDDVEQSMFHVVTSMDGITPVAGRAIAATSTMTTTGTETKRRTNIATTTRIATTAAKSVAAF
jgi:hypothetical protein